MSYALQARCPATEDSMATDDSNPLAELLEATGMSQSELARLLGVSQGSINRKANGHLGMRRSEKIFFRLLLELHRADQDISSLLKKAAI